MATYTTYLNLKKPAVTENFNLVDINANWDKIDSGVSALNSNLTMLDGLVSTGKTTTTISDLSAHYDSMTNSSFGIARFGSNSTSAPTTGGGICIIFKSSANYGAQQVLSDSGLYYRKKSSTWSEWTKIV